VQVQISFLALFGGASGLFHNVGVFLHVALKYWIAVSRFCVSWGHGRFQLLMKRKHTQDLRLSQHNVLC